MVPGQSTLWVRKPEGGSGRPLLTGCRFNSHGMQEPLRSWSGRPAPAGTPARPERASLGQPVPPGPAPTSASLSLRRARLGPGWGGPLVRRFSNRKSERAEEAVTSPPPSLPRPPDASEPGPQKELRFGRASAASPMRVEPGKGPAGPGNPAPLPGPRRCGATSRLFVCRRATARKPHFPACLARPRRREEPLFFVTMGTSRSRVPVVGPCGASSCCSPSGALASGPGQPTAERAERQPGERRPSASKCSVPGVRALLGPRRSEAKGPGRPGLARPRPALACAAPLVPRQRLPPPAEGGRAADRHSRGAGR